MTECTGCPDCNALASVHPIASMPLTLNVSLSGGGGGGWGVDVQSVDNVYFIFLFL